jgi:RNA polymerase sigma-70 factor (sigma-E family)
VNKEEAPLDEDFEAFVTARGSALLRTAVLLSAGSRHDAEDVLQSALERAYRQWRRIDGDPEPYVRRILVNLVINRTRRFRVLRELSFAAPPERPDRDGPDIPLRTVLLDELRTLPPRQRAVLVLRYWEDLSEAETADLLGCAVGTVKSQAARGLAKLRVSTLEALS